jgi:hypothetical protein
MLLLSGSNFQIFLDFAVIGVRSIADPLAEGLISAEPSGWE